MTAACAVAFAAPATGRVQRRIDRVQKTAIGTPLASHPVRHAAPVSRRALQCRADSSSAGSASTATGGLAQLLHDAQSAPDSLQWSRATVVENRHVAVRGQASVDGSVRTLCLSVEDHVTFLEGRKVRHVQESRRWIDDYRVPGQFVAVRYCASGGTTEECRDLRVAARLQCLASSPYEARRDSAMLDASLVELLVSRGNNGDEQRLSELGPGDTIDVSRVAGNGFASLFNSEVNLGASLEAGHPLLVLAAGTRGIAPVRAALSWTPVLAHAGNSRVTVFYVADKQSEAAYVLEWDLWREAGVQVHPMYLNEEGGASSAEGLLQAALFEGEHGLAGLLGGAHPRDAAVLMSGLEGEPAAQLTRKLAQHGVPSERIMFADY